ncbi:MAG: FliH/SctL family protein [Nevskia sp.]|nr:FliH/SctL family protein [Nevskia sp.]
MSDALAPDFGAAAQRWEMPVFNAGEGGTSPRLHTAAQLDALEAAAHEEGFARGHAEGFAAGAAEARAQAQRLRELLEHCSKPLAYLDAEVEAALADLALQAARRLVQREFELDPELMAATIHEAIAALVTVPRELRVHLHPDDVRLLQETLKPPPDVTHWRLVPDATLARGDCRISGDTGWVDATLATRERALSRALLGDREAAP